MSKVRADADGKDPAADEASALLHRPGSALEFEIEHPPTDEARSHNTCLRRIWRGFVNAFAFGNAQHRKRQLILLVLLSLTLITGVYLAWSIMTPSSSSGTGDIRIVLLADAHLIGPQYINGNESNDLDNESIMKTADRLREAQQKIEALRPRPKAVIFLGDVIHNGYVSKNFEWYKSNRNAYTVGQEIFRMFTLPVWYLWGNHDYHTTCGNANRSYDRFELSHKLFEHFFGDAARPFSVQRAGRYKLLFLNGMLGPSWDPGHPRCDTRVASLGEKQLSWLAGELQGKEPVFVFLHHPLPATMRSEVAGSHRHPDVLSLLVAHSKNIMAVFSGHYHRGLDWQDAYPFPHRTLPSCRYDSDNWFVLHLPASGPVRSWELLDWGKNKGGARCSETWEYPGDERWWRAPRPLEPQPPEDGSCGSPTSLQEDLHQAELPPLGKADEVPGPSGRQFNPERSCSLEYQAAFLNLCMKDGPTVDCCAILGQHLRASSAAYGASCMCCPRFWQQAHRLFRDNATTNRNLTEVLQRCQSDFGTALQWPGRPGGSCMAPGSPEVPPPE